MRNEKPSDVLLVSRGIASASQKGSFSNDGSSIGRPRTYFTSFHQTLAKLSDGIPTIDDDRAWGDWHLEVSHLSDDYAQWTNIILSYQHHSIDEPAFLLGMAFPLDEKSGS